MGWVFAVLATVLGIVFLWGVVAPRSLWRVLSSWSVSDPHRSEPGGAAYGWNRLIAGIGVVSLLTVAGVTLVPGWLHSAQSAPGLTPIEEMWGSPQPMLVNRTITSVGAAPGGLVEVPVIDYQAFDEDDGPPTYLTQLKDFTRLGQIEIPGYVGVVPDVGFSGVDFSDMLLHVRGPILCIPRQVLVVETEETVQVAVYYGLPDPGDGSIPDNAVECPADASLTGSLLIPIILGAPVGDRQVIALDGSEIGEVPLP